MLSAMFYQLSYFCTIVFTKNYHKVQYLNSVHNSFLYTIKLKQMRTGIVR